MQEDYIDVTRALLAHPDVMDYIAARVMRTLKMELMTARTVYGDVHERMLALWLARMKTMTPKKAGAMNATRIISMLERQEIKNAEKRAEDVASKAAYERRKRAGKIHGGGWFSKHCSRVLCLDCRGINAHAAGCAKDYNRECPLPVGARVPKRDASGMRWKQFGESMGNLGYRKIQQEFA